MQLDQGREGLVCAVAYASGGRRVFGRSLLAAALTPAIDTLIVLTHKGPEQKLLASTPAPPTFRLLLGVTRQGRSRD